MPALHISVRAPYQCAQPYTGPADTHDLLSCFLPTAVTSRKTGGNVASNVLPPRQLHHARPKHLAVPEALSLEVRGQAAKQFLPREQLPKKHRAPVAVAVPAILVSPPVPERPAAEGLLKDAEAQLRSGATKQGELLLRQAAAMNYAPAQYRLARLLTRAQGGLGATDSKSREAFKLLQQAAEQGHSRAALRLALCHMHGHGVTKNPEAAVRMIRPLAETDSNAAAVLGICLLHGRGCGRAPAEAVVWLQRAADCGHRQATLMLAECILRGDGVAADPARAASIFQKMADQGSVGGMVALGDCLLAGLGVAPDPFQAVALFHRAEAASNACNPHAEERLAECYETGRGVVVDLPEAVKWHERAAAHGSAKAQVALARALVDGTGALQSDPARAVQLLEEAVASGHVEAMVYLGYLFGAARDGITRDLGRAVQLFMQAAELGSPQGQLSLGLCVAARIGRSHILCKQSAASLFLAAAEQGLPEAMLELALCQTGKADAIAWLRKAADLGLPAAAKELDKALLLMH